jgi:uncharacterized protein (DUF2164 family)
VARIESNFKINEIDKKRILEEIIEFRVRVHGEIGELAAEVILEFFIKKMAPEFYNMGIRDAMRFMSQSIEDMAGLEKY